MAAVVPNHERLFNLEYVQLHSVAEQGDSRHFHAEGPIVVSKGQGAETADPRPPLLHIGMPENMITWALTPDLPTLKVQRTAFMAAVPYSTRFYIIDFLPETPDDVLVAFEKVLAGCTSYAVANLLVDGAEGGSAGATAAMPAGEQEQVEAASGTPFTVSPATAGKIRSASAALSQSIYTAGEHVGKGIVRAGEWYRRRNEGKQTNVAVSEAHTRRMERAKSTTSKMASVTGSVAGVVGAAIGSAANVTKEGLKSSGIIREGGKTHRTGSRFKEGVIALVEVFDSMYDVGRTVVKTGVDETVTCVQYRYGDEVASLSRSGFGMIVDAYDVYGAYKRMQHKALARAFFKGSIGMGDQGARQPEDGAESTGASPNVQGAHTSGAPAHAGVNPSGMGTGTATAYETPASGGAGPSTEPKQSTQASGSAAPPQGLQGSGAGSGAQAQHAYPTAQPPQAPPHQYQQQQQQQRSVQLGQQSPIQEQGNSYMPPGSGYQVYDAERGGYSAYEEGEGVSVELLGPLPGPLRHPHERAQMAQPHAQRY